MSQQPGNSQNIHFLDMAVYAELFRILPNYLPMADCQKIFNDLRDVLPTTGFHNLKTVHSAVSMCTKCKDLEYTHVMPSWNLLDPDIVFVASNSKFTSAGSDLFISSLKNSGFNSSRCALTYAVRCAGKNINETCYTNCSSFLHAELSAWRPNLIVLMGKGALTSFSSSFKDEKISSIAGNIYWLGPWAYMPIESPDSAAFKDNTTDYIEYFRTAFDFCYGNNT